MRPWWLLILLVPFASAQVTSGPEVVVLVFHPDDGIDPLGFTYKDGLDGFIWRNNHLERFANGVDYPGLVIDGRVPYDGLATGDDVLAATYSVYNAATTMRLGVETPISLDVSTEVNGTLVKVQVGLQSVVDLSNERLNLWSAIVEDPVFYKPPTGLTNGVFDHPFTVRDLRLHMPIATQGDSGNATIFWDFEILPAWKLENLRLAVWVQQGAEDGRFKPHEVAQATMHPLTSTGITRQVERGVLVEAYSATWCEPCLIGDRALEALAANHGLAPNREVSQAAAIYWQAPGNAGLVAVAAAAAFAVLALARFPGAKK